MTRLWIIGCAVLPACIASTDGPAEEPLLDEPSTLTGSGGEAFTTHQTSGPEARAHARDRCDAGELSACHRAGLDAYHLETPDDDREAVAYFRQACGAGYVPSCNGLGAMYEAGRGVPADLDTATRLYRNACDAGHTTGCHHLEQVYRVHQHDDVAASRARARLDCLRQQTSEGLACPTLED
ncbi:MAG: tetratricopeptide repeat protein [Myxococcota bacterium]